MNKKFILIAVFAAVGALLLGLSYAGTTASVAVESDANLEGGVILEDDQASGSKYVEFKSHDHEPPDSVPILYTGEGQYDSTVIPEDDRIVVPYFGINRAKGQQLFTVDCLHSHTGYDDPIVFPGQVDRSHLHEFFGDTSLDSFSTIESIIGNPDNTCEVGGDRSAYWTPVAYQDNKIVYADNNKFYYKVGDVDPTKIQPMPLGLRMVAGNAHATSPGSKQIMYMFATPGQGKTTEPHSKESGNSPDLFRIKSDDNGLRLQIQFPQCWDGKHLWLPGTAHMAYPDGKNCPDTHPIPFLQLQFNLGYTDAVGGPGFRFDSGAWYTGHGDFVNGWRPDTFERLVDVCLRSKRYCGLTNSKGSSCNSKTGVKNDSYGCIELRKGETEPRFFGKSY